MTHLIPANQSLFDSIKKTDEQGCEYWQARELQKVLEYTNWQNFESACEAAKTVCASLGVEPKNHIIASSKVAELGSGATREVFDYKLTRFGSYLVTMNCDGRKPRVAEAQIYFAMMTIKAEILNSNPPQSKTELNIFSDANYQLAKEIGETAKQLAAENLLMSQRIQELEARLSKLQAPALPPSDGIRIKELLRCCGVTIDSNDGTLFSRLALDLRKAVESGMLPQRAIASRGKYRYLAEVQGWVQSWLNIR